MSVARIRSAFVSALVYGLLLAGTVIMLMPFLWTLVSAVKLPQETMTYPIVWVPSRITFEHLREAWGTQFPIYYRNSAIVAVAVLLGNVFTSALAGFIFAKYDFPLKNALFLIILSTLMIPFVIVLIPTYVLVAMVLKLKDNLLGLIVPWIVSPFGIFLMRQFIETIPGEMIDAGRIDGASDWRIFGQIILPLCQPALSALMIFHFIWIWNDFLWPLIMCDSNRSRTLPVGVAAFASQHWLKYNLTIAGSVLVLLPMLAVYLIFQRAFVQGIVLTGMKY